MSRAKNISAKKKVKVKPTLEDTLRLRIKKLRRPGRLPGVKDLTCANGHQKLTVGVATAGSFTTYVVHCTEPGCSWSVEVSGRSHGEGYVRDKVKAGEQGFSLSGSV